MPINVRQEHHSHPELHPRSSIAHLPFCCRISISRSPASPRTNCDTRLSARLLDSLGRAVVEDLRLVGRQPRERIEHHHAVGHLLRRPHVVRHHDARDRMLLPRAEDQLVDHVAHDRVQARWWARRRA